LVIADLPVVEEDKGVNVPIIIQIRTKDIRAGDVVFDVPITAPN
jgi:hypothetical protein